MRLLMSVMALALALCGPAAVVAQIVPPVAASRVAALSDLLLIDRIVAIMREEGLIAGREMGRDMFPDRAPAGWEAVVSLIYDPADMRRRFDAAFEASLEGSLHLAEIERFFASALGQTVLSLEVAARLALLDPVAEEAAKRALAEMQQAVDPRLTALAGFVDTNNLIESNVMAALNSNLAFFQGLAEGAALQDMVPEDQILADVWAQEPQIRAEMTDWLMPYLALAYRPLDDADLAAYQTFSETPAGQAINTALFSAFDALFTAISRDLGRAAARQMQGQEL